MHPFIKKKFSHDVMGISMQNLKLLKKSHQSEEVAVRMIMDNIIWFCDGYFSTVVEEEWDA